MPRKFSPPSGTFQRSSSPSSIWSLIGDWGGISNEWSMISFLSVHPRSRNTLTKKSFFFFFSSLHHRDNFLQLFSLKHTFLCCSSSIKVHPDRNIIVWRSCCSVKIPRCNKKFQGISLWENSKLIFVYFCVSETERKRLFGTGTQENVTKKTLKLKLQTIRFHSNLHRETLSHDFFTWLWVSIGFRGPER